MKGAVKIFQFAVLAAYVCSDNLRIHCSSEANNLDCALLLHEHVTICTCDALSLLPPPSKAQSSASTECGVLLFCSIERGLPLVFSRKNGALPLPPTHICPNIRRRCALGIIVNPVAFDLRRPSALSARKSRLRTEGVSLGDASPCGRAVGSRLGWDRAC